MFHNDETQPALLGLIGEIYEAGLDPTRWSEVISGAAGLMGGTSGLVYGLDDARLQAGWFGHHFPAEAMERYVAHYRLTNLWAHEIDRRRVPVGRPVVTDALVDPAALERSEFYADYLSDLDIHRACTVLLHKDAETSAESHLCVYRSRSTSPFDAEAERLMRLLVPHLQRAQRIGITMAQLDLHAHSAYAAIDALSTGVAMLTPQGTVQHLNPAAEAILGERDGLAVVQGRLSAARASDTAALGRLVARSCRWQAVPVGGALQLERPSGRRPLQLVFTPLSARSGGPVGADLGAAALCLISGHERQMKDAQTLLPQLFGFTRAETHLAVGLLDGLSIADFAAANGVSTNTAKTHLSGLFAKTGTHRQGELMAVLRAACGHLRVAD